MTWLQRTPAPIGCRPGTTLFELVMVLTILASITAIAVPRFSNAIRRQRLDRAAWQVSTDLRLARTHAIRDKASRRVVFEPGLARYRLPELPSQTATGSEYTGTMPEGVRLVSASFGAANLAEVSFNRLGIPSGAGTVVLRDGLEQVAISVSATSGRVSRVFSPASP